MSDLSEKASSSFLVIPTKWARLDVLSRTGRHLLSRSPTTSRQVPSTVIYINAGEELDLVLPPDLYANVRLIASSTDTDLVTGASLEHRVVSVFLEKANL